MPLLALVPIALTLLPAIGRWLAGDTGETVAQAAAAAVQSVTGASTPHEAQAALDANPALRMELTQRLAEITADREFNEQQAFLDQMRIVNADVANARQQTIALAQAGSPLSWSTAVVSILAVLVFGLATVSVVFVDLPPRAEILASVLYGASAAGYAQVLGYYLGSSAGSARKEGALRGVATAAAVLPLVVEREPRR